MFAALIYLLYLSDRQTDGWADRQTRKTDTKKFAAQHQQITFINLLACISGNVTMKVHYLTAS